MSKKDKIHVVSRAVIMDKDHILVCKTCDLPVPFYFLPGGHVEHGESAEQAILRELLEETGKKFNVKRFLGCLEYSFEPGYSSICHNHEYNFIFEVDTPLKFGDSLPKLEAHIELMWLPLSTIGNIDFRAEPLQNLIPKWLKTDASHVFSSEMYENNRNG
jgi:ADP-ribose pyrophosphatase YjhB (NUDIX family)